MDGLAGESVDDLDVQSVEVEFMQLDGRRCRRLLTESRPVAFEDVPPVRRYAGSAGLAAGTFSGLVVVGDNGRVLRRKFA